MAGFPIHELRGRRSVDLTIEQRYETLERIFVHQFFELYRILGRRFGWHVANEIAMEVPNSSVPLIVEGYRRKFGLGGEGAALLCQVLQAEFQAEGSDVDVLVETADDATFEVECAFGAALTSGRYDDVEIAPGLCHEGCAGWMGRVGRTLDPPVRAERTAWMGEGAARCRFALRRAGLDAAEDDAPANH